MLIGSRLVRYQTSIPKGNLHSHQVRHSARENVMCELTAHKPHKPIVPVHAEYRTGRPPRPGVLYAMKALSDVVTVVMTRRGWLGVVSSSLGTG